MKPALLIPPIVLIFAFFPGCGNGPDVIGGHDYSSFYDFGFDDVKVADTNQHDISREISHNDTRSDESTPSDQGDGDSGTDIGGWKDIPKDTTATGPGVVFVANKAWETHAKALISGAKHTVDLAHLEFLTYDPDISIATALKSAAARGVKIRVLLDNGVASNPDRVSDLNSVTNITAKLDGRDITTHVKLIVADDSDVLVGSTNLSKSALFHNNEANLRITDSGATAEFADYFDSLWSSPGSKKGMAATMTASGILPIGDYEYVDSVTGLIENATDRINVMMYDINPDSYLAKNLTDQLIDAAGRGVDVRVFLERSADDWAAYVTEDNLESAGILENGGVEVKLDQEADFSGEYETVTHAKLLIADDTVVVYSGNWSTNGLKDNHEAGAVVDGVESVTSAAANWFDNLWQSGFDYN